MDKINKTIIIGINLGDFGSTGTIMRNSLEYAHNHGNFDYLIIVPKSEGKPNTYSYFDIHKSTMDKLDRHFIHRSINNPDGFYERRATLRIISKIKEECDKYKNVIVHMHNIHMAHIDLRILFKYLSKERRITKVYYSLHDLWSFTGGCYWFERERCEKWKTGCKGDCIKNYSKKHFSTAKNLKLKDKYTHMLKNKLTFCPVSNWCNYLLKQSVMKDIPSIVVEGECNIRAIDNRDVALQRILGIDDNEKILMTIDGWKGYEYLDQFVEKIPDGYKFILINGKKKYCSNKVIQIDRINNLLLPLFFSITDCFVSLTQEDNLPLTIMEAQNCGVPVVGFGQNGTPEEIIEGVTGTMVGKDNNIDKLIQAIINTVENKPYKKDDIIGNGKRFERMASAKKMFNIYNGK